MLKATENFIEAWLSFCDSTDCVMKLGIDSGDFWKRKCREVKATLNEEGQNANSGSVALDGVHILKDSRSSSKCKNSTGKLTWTC